MEGPHSRVEAISMALRGFPWGDQGSHSHVATTSIFQAGVFFLRLISSQSVFQWKLFHVVLVCFSMQGLLHVPEVSFY